MMPNNSKFSAFKTPLDELTLLERRCLPDERGYLQRMFCDKDLAHLIGNRAIKQVNHTLTAHIGTVRGLHFQHPPHAEMKLVSCIRGKIFDVVVDLRRESHTFLSWHSVILSDDNNRTLLIPEGFAHGFQSLTDDCELLYFHTSPFRQDAEAALNALDRRLSIAWPLPITKRSKKDVSIPPMSDDFLGI